MALLCLSTVYFFVREEPSETWTRNLPILALDPRGHSTQLQIKIKSKSKTFPNCELKVKLWRACERKKNVFFVTCYLPDGNFRSICFLSQFIVYWINLQNIYTFICQKTLLHRFLLLNFKIFESLQCIMKNIS